MSGIFVNGVSGQVITIFANIWPSYIHLGVLGVFLLYVMISRSWETYLQRRQRKLSCHSSLCGLVSTKSMVRGTTVALTSAYMQEAVVLKLMVFFCLGIRIVNQHNNEKFDFDDLLELFVGKQKIMRLFVGLSIGEIHCLGWDIAYEFLFRSQSTGLNLPCSGEVRPNLFAKRIARVFSIPQQSSKYNKVEIQRNNLQLISFYYLDCDWVEGSIEYSGLRNEPPSMRMERTGSANISFWKRKSKKLISDNFPQLQK